MDELAYAARRSTRSSCGCATTPPSTRAATRGPATACAECLRLGAERFGWAERDPAPRTTRDGDWLIGTGMAAAAYPIAFFMPDAARAGPRSTPTAARSCRRPTQEFGTGVADDGDPGRRRRPRRRPRARSSSRPATATCPTRTSAVGLRRRRHGQLRRARRRHARCATQLDRPGRRRRQLAAARRRPGVGDGAGRAHDAARPSGRGETLRRAAARATTWPTPRRSGSWRPPPLDTPHGLLTFGAQFAEVAVDPELGLVRVRRLVGAFAPGPRAQPAARPQPADGRHAVGAEPGAARGQRTWTRATGRWAATQPRRVPRPGQRRRPRRRRSSSSRCTTTSSARSAPRAWARSARSASPPRSPTRSSTRPAGAIRELPIAPELVMDPPRRR